MTVEIINQSIETTALDQLQRHPQNPRQGDVGAVHASFDAHGFYGTIVAQRSTGHIIVGNHRYLAAVQAGMTELPVAFVDVDDETALRIMLADNRTSDIGSYDDSELLDLLRQLDATPRGLDGLGYDADDMNDIANMLGTIGSSGDGSGDGSSQLDRADELHQKWGIETGDLWRIGEQHIIVGDSTDPEVWARVNRAVGPISMLVTSPPYLQQRDYTTKIGDWDGLMNGVFESFNGAELHDDAQAFVNLGLVHREKSVIRYWEPWLDSMQTLGWRLTGWYVWDQGAGIPRINHGWLASSHEFVFHIAKNARTAAKTKKCSHAGETLGITHGFRQKDGSMLVGDTTKKISDFRVPDSVLRVNRQTGKHGAQSSHPAIFPPDVPREYIEAFSKRDEVIIDPFVGSGSTLLAAADLNRRGVGIEIEPKYAAVVLERLHESGATPELVEKLTS